MEVFILIGLVFFGVIAMLRSFTQPEPPQIIYVQPAAPVRDGSGCLLLLVLGVLVVVALLILSLGSL
jgi:hypothetical protein